MTPKSWLPLFCAALLAPMTWAATKEEYRAASVNGVRESGSFGRAKNMVRMVLAGKPDGTIAVVGRGEIMFVSRLLVAGRLTNDTELLGLAKDIALACNKVANDGYDTPQQFSIEQIGFALRELSLAVPQLKELKLIAGRDAERTDETLKKACDFLLKFKPEPGDGNIDQRYALGIASVCNMFPDDPRVATWKAWAAKPFLHVLHYPDQKGLPGSVRRVLEKNGAKWKFVEDTKPFEAVHGPDISEDSSGYEASTIVSWMGIARLIGREAEIKTSEVEAFIDRFYQQVMPVGILPAYGDADWGGSSELTTPALRPAASATWRELIKRIWEVDPLLCPRCGTEMVKLAAIRDPVVITHILRHVHMWEEPPARGPPLGGTVYEPCYDDPPAAADTNEQASAAAEQVFPDYDRYDPGPVKSGAYESADGAATRRSLRSRPTPAGHW